MRRACVCFLVTLLAACNYNETPLPPPPGMSTTDADTRSEVRALPVVATISGLSGPESALYDPQQDVYFISNMNGSLLDQDDNGFITRVDAKTLQVDLKWIEAGKNNVKLDTPKGMAIVGDSLYVSDTTAVRKFDRHSGAPQGSIELPGATTINDLTTDGKAVYVSDTGVVPGSGDTFTPTGTDAIWKIENDRATKIASGHDKLKQPNGLEWSNGKLWVVTFGGNELYSLNGDRVGDVTNVEREQLDGVVAVGDTFYVTSWRGMCVYRISGKSITPVLQGIPTPADIGYDSTRHLLMVPATSSNRVTLHKTN